MKNEIIIIAAIGKNNELGKNNDLIWKIPGDLKRFKTLTQGHPIIMGYKTFESLGSRALPGRTNIVMALTETPGGDVAVARSLNEAIVMAKKAPGNDKIFIIGGGTIYKLFLPLADTLNLTIVDKTDDKADVFFPEFDENDFNEISREEKEIDGLKFAFVVSQKKHKY